jgi:hypothetical protein
MKHDDDNDDGGGGDDDDDDDDDSYSNILYIMDIKLQATETDAGLRSIRFYYHLRTTVAI